MNHIETLGKEKANIKHLIESIPFNQKSTVDGAHFLNIYQLTYEDIVKLNEENEKFPIDSNKLLKLGISLGNLIKSLQLDEELYTQQQQLQQQQKQFMTNMNNIGPKTPRGLPNDRDNENQNPFNVINSSDNTSSTSQPTYQVKFMKNLLSILKNFDIGSTYSMNQINLKLQAVLSNTSSSTLGQNNVTTSPIKLNSKQLLIEKLEISIKLDTLFIYKIIIELILKIYTIIEKHLLTSENANNGYNDEAQNNAPGSQSPSIFSSSSNGSDASPQINEYYKIMNQVMNRISSGVTDPFIRVILTQIIHPSINDQVDSYISTLV